MHMLPAVEHPDLSHCPASYSISPHPGQHLLHLCLHWFRSCSTTSSVLICLSLSHIIVVTFMLFVVLLTGATHTSILCCRHAQLHVVATCHSGNNARHACVSMCSGCMQVGSILIYLTPEPWSNSYTFIGACSSGGSEMWLLHAGRITVWLSNTDSIMRSRGGCSRSLGLLALGSKCYSTLHGACDVLGL